MAQLGGVTLLTIGGTGALLSAGAHAASLTSGPVSINTVDTVTTGTPYSSGQQVNIAVGANSTMNQASLEAAGFPSGAVAIKALECSDPGGLVANLPTKPSECQADTIDSISGANADGSFNINGYTIYALPNNITFGEGASGPLCDNGDACVVGLFSNYTDFSKPHLFSAAYYVAPNSDDGGENPGDGSQLAASPVSATKSTVIAAPTAAVADGVDSSKITVTLEDKNGIPIGGKQVTLTQGTGKSIASVGGTVTNVATTNATTGVANFTVTDTTTEAVTFTATDSTDGVTLAMTAMVTFAAPVVSPSNSSIFASPTAVASNGTSTITVTLEDQAVAPQPVAGKVVSLSQGTGHSTINPSSATTNASGEAIFTVTGTIAEVDTYTANDTTDVISLNPKSASVTFGSVMVSASASTVSASPGVVSTAAAGGVLPTGMITVTLLASDGSSSISGKTVTLSASSSTAEITPSSDPDVTNGNGEATFNVADGTAETVTFTATDVSDSIQITHTAMVNFQVPAASSSKSVVTVSATMAPADGVTSVAIDVTLADQFGHPIAGVSISAAGSPSATTRVAPQTESTSTPAGTTDSTGKAVFFAYDTTAETVTYTATDTTDNVVLDQTVSVTYLAGVPQASDSTLSANPTAVPADGTTSSTVTVTLEDHNGNPVPAKAITLVAATGSSSITPSSSMTDTKGQATFKVTDAASEVVFYTATDTTDSLPLAGQGVTVTFGTPPPPVPAIADSTVVVEPSQVPADGSTSATVTVVLADANGDPVSGKTVALNPASGNSSVVTVTGVTDGNGEATFAVTDKTAEEVTYTATDVTDNLPITGQSVTVTFTPSAGTSGSGSTTSTSSSTTSTTPTTTTSTTPAPASTIDSTTSSGDTSAGASSSAVTASSGALAFTGAPNLWPWSMGVGLILFVLGGLGRRALRPRIAE